MQLRVDRDTALARRPCHERALAPICTPGLSTTDIKPPASPEAVFCPETGASFFKHIRGERRQRGAPLKTNSATPVCLPGEGCGSLGCEGPWQTIVCVTIAPLRLSVTTCCPGFQRSSAPTCRPTPARAPSAAAPHTTFCQAPFFYAPSSDRQRQRLADRRRGRDAGGLRGGASGGRRGMRARACSFCST